MAEFKVITDTVAHMTGKMGFLNKRHEIISQNIAHMETPNYIGSEMTFEGFIEESMQPHDVAYDVASEVLPTNDEVKPNGNNVQMEHEMAKISENSIEYSTAVNLLKKNLSLMKYSVES